ncbi:5610_t:CDS:2 [Acaulospora colombiana]|uniref:5610_t:CDS:1 n=1 Tax=Acaulospora colombiana TaxID=27376 RepID=A0ACA9KZX3_9GLOM|nr:5610_t:CDS:2 [Acaulospora colombiana]
MSTEFIIPPTPCTNEKNDILESPSSSDIFQNPPPPPYSELDVEELIKKSREVLTGHSEYLAGGGEKKEKEMFEKITQVESLLQTILSDQTFAMHHLRSQLSDIQTVLKKMHKQETVTNEEIQKLTENLVTSDNVRFKFEASRDETEVMSEVQDVKVVDGKSVRNPIYEELHISNPTPALSAILAAPPTLSVSQRSSRAPSSASSRDSSPPPPSSRVGSRDASPSREKIVSDDFSSRPETDSPESLSVIHSTKNSEFSKIDEGSDSDDDEDSANNEFLDRMVGRLKDLISEAADAVKEPIAGREDLSKLSILNCPDFDFSDIDRDLDALEEDSSCDFEEAESEGKQEKPKKVRGNRRGEKPTSKVKGKEESFEDNMDKFYQNLDKISHLVDTIATDEQVNDEVQDEYLQYEDSTADLIRNPSENLADLDDFSQQCRLLTRALILPFLHATHSFMSESLKTSVHSRQATSTTRTFMNLMYWTFLFTLGSLVLDAWLCEVAGRQVIRVVGSLKPGRPFGIIANGFNMRDADQQDGGMGMLEDGKKKNVKFRTAPRSKAVTWNGVESGMKGGEGGWLKDDVMGLSRRGGRLLTGGGRWGGSKLFRKMSVGRFEEEEFSEDSDEWEIVDFDSSEDEESGAEDDDIEDPAFLLKRKITNERLRRAGHVIKSIHEETSEMSEENNVDKNDVSFIENDIKTFGEITTTNTTSKTLTEPEEYDMDEDESDVDEFCDLNIPGSFPSSIDLTENVRRVRSVVLRRPRRNGPFGGSGGFWVMKTRKIIKRCVTDMDVSAAVKKRSSLRINPVTREKSSKSPSLPKRIRIRRNSI